MSDAILLLRLEHGNMARLLDWIENQLQILETGTAVDHTLLSNAIYYLQNYPDQCHHPKEDLVLEAMVRRSPEAAAAVGDLTGEHEKIADLTMKAADLLNQAGSPGDDRGLKDALRDLTSEYRHHMEMEEKLFFPRAMEILNRSDWDTIDFELFDRDDPLFNHSREQRFRELREGIARHAENSQKMAAVTQEIELLKNLNGIEDFNLAMEQQGSKLRLLRFTEGGYGMEREGSLLAYIPSLEEIRAIWCAYFYAKGAEDINLA